MDSLSSIVTDKFHFRKLLKEAVLQSDIDKWNELTNKDLDKAFAFVKGYWRCLEYFSHLPINKQELLQLLLQECLQYLLNDDDRNININL